MHNGFLRVAAAAPQVRVADTEYNLARIMEKLHEFESQRVELAVFPEMSLTAYTCGDLFQNSTLLDAASDSLARLVEYSAITPMHFIVGLPIRLGPALYNLSLIHI